jgi:hypothetical protein
LKSTADADDLPAEVEIEVADRRRDRWPGRVVQNDQTARADELPKKVQVHEYFVEAMAAIDERRIGRESLVREACERDRGHLVDERGPIGQTGGDDGVPAHVVVRRRLKRVDHDVRRVRPASDAERLPDRQRRASIRQPDLDHGASAVGDEQVAQNVAVRLGQRDALEVALERSSPFRA